MFYLDLDELNAVSEKFSLVKHNRKAIYEFRDKDHIWMGHDSIRENLTAWLKTQGIIEPLGKVYLMTNLRTFGHIFNPVSFYFCSDRSGNPLCMVAEVHNTFGELKPYLLKNENWDGKHYKDVQIKHFYISPFSELDTELGFKLSLPEDRFLAKIDSRKPDGTQFYSVLSGEKLELSTKNLLFCTARYPFITLKVVWLIHWHALGLYLKKVPFFKKRANLELQRGIVPKAHQLSPK